MFRLPRLDLRPMHTDEAVHTSQAGTLLQTGQYVYNPEEYHGPTPYYFALPIIWFNGVKTLAETDETMFRMVPAFFGVLLVLLLIGIKDALGLGAAILAAILTAVFVAGTAFATAKDAPAPVADESSDNASISFSDGNVEYNGKTGWQMIGDLANHIR